MDNQFICHNCKSIVPPGSLLCPSCGTRITQLKVQGDTASVNTATMRLISDTGSMYLPEGTILQGKYRINKVLGQGGFGITYDGTDLKLQMHIAIKEYFPSQVASRSSTGTREVTCSSATSAMYEQGMQNFLKEARNMAKFAGQDNFVSVHDFFIENNTAYIIMEFVDGQNLRDCMKQHGRYSMESAMTIITPVLDTLDKIHADEMIHRDISPSNIMLLPDGKVKLLDFGAVREISQETQTLTSMSAVYKKGYSPIEQQTPDMRQGTYTDIYALCATLYEMLTGSVPPSPFSRMSGDEQLIPPSRLGAAISPTQENALLKGLEVYGKDRIQTVDELRKGLTSQADPGKKGGPRTDSSDRGSGGSHDGSKKPPLPVIFTAVAVIAGIALGLFLVKLTSGNDSENGSQSVSNNPAPAAQTTVAEDTDTMDSSDTADDTGGSSDDSSADVNVADDINTDPGDSTDSDDSDVSADSTDSNDSTDSTVSTEDSTPEPEYPSDAVSYNGHHYYIYADDASSWEKAMLNCVNRGGYLAVINDSDENETLYQYVVDEGRDLAFFGLIYQDGDWEYLAGGNSDFRDWGYNNENEKQPNNADKKMYHVTFDIYMHDGHWSDSEFGKQTYTTEGHHYEDICTYICEWDY